MPIPVIWHSQEDGRGFYNCCAMVNHTFDYYTCQHFTKFQIERAARLYPQAVFVVHGGREPGDIDRLNRDLEFFKGVIVILLGDEECQFPVELIEHPNMIMWVQEPQPGRHDKYAQRYILDGYTPASVKEFDAIEKDLDWVFAGQVTHERRRACVTQLQGYNWGGIIVETKGYCQGVSLPEYYRLLLRAKIVPCPSGPLSPDSARVCEALQCHAVPILDDLSPTRSEPGFWNLVLGAHHPFEVLTDWRDLGESISVIKTNYDAYQRNAMQWWRSYKVDFDEWLGQDWKEICRRSPF